MLQKALTATGIVSLGNITTSDLVGAMVFQVIGATWTGSAVPKIRVFGKTIQSAAGIADANLKTTPYLNLATGAVVAAGTAITADGIYAVVAPGLEVVLDYTHTSGTAQVLGYPVEGTIALLLANIANLANLIGDTTYGIYVQAKARPATVTVTSVTTAATQIVAANAARAGLTIENHDASINMFIGTSSGVTTANGYKVPAGGSVALGATNNAWFGIAASGTVAAGAIEA